ncbi:hypothetical protein [Streptosporangium carneum]|uniref:DUF916 domain-containing protein n=1 Tax=Streptosporangium carneum TaxID=47481 RepID=A0A9W6MF91_9ACTN|nr:hypothetical protein [Streptosporangium carneum]GLK11815.1 hypothetical protein GCM10017600_52230 [Streptosporangium carneum]
MESWRPEVIRRSRFTGVVGSWLVAVCLSWAAAQDVDAAPAPEPGFSLSVSPTKLVVPPEQLDAEQTFRVTNGGDAPVDVHVDRSDFTADDSGALVLRERAPYSASTWITAVPERLRLPPGTTGEVRVRIAVPGHPEPGDHHVALVFKAVAGQRSGTVTINRGIGVPLYIGVPGHADDSAEVTDLRAPGFVTGGPVPLTAGVRNTGTAHRDFRAVDRLNASIDGTAVPFPGFTGTAVPFPGFTVTRGATREVTALWDPPLMCVCQATVAVADGSARAVTRTIVVFPVHLLAALLAALALAFLLVRSALRGHRARLLALAGVTGPAHGGGDD